jgi:hypothetical protein
MKIPVTAVLRIVDARRRLAVGNLDATLEVHPPSDVENVRLGSQDVPLRSVGSAPGGVWGSAPTLLAASVNGSGVEYRSRPYGKNEIAATPASPIHRRNLSSVIGRSRTRLPVA